MSESSGIQEGNDGSGPQPEPVSPHPDTAAGTQDESPDARVKVLYLGGQARSGSTLLDRALGQIPGFCSSGEVRYLWDRGLIENQICGCGEPLRDCPFWHQVGIEAFGGWDRIEPREVLWLRHEVDGMRNLPLLALPAASKTFSSKLELYGRYVRRVFEAVAKVSGDEVVIDSSMSPPHGLVLSRVPGIDFRVVHLVRDSRGVAHSSNKQVQRPEIKDGVGYMPRYSPASGAARWMAANLVFELLATRVPETRVRYESFVRTPRDVLGLIAAHMGVDLEPEQLSFVSNEKVELSTNHTAAGNPMRFKVGTLPLRLDEEWRVAMRPGHRTLVTALTWPLLRRYRYLGGEG